MERYITFGNINSYLDWHLILTEKIISLPEVKSLLVNIEGRSGSLDLTESLTQDTPYKDRTISFKFWTDFGTREDRNRLFNNIILMLHGKKIDCISDPDRPNEFLKGRLKVQVLENNRSYGEILVTGICDPFYYREKTVKRIDLGISSTLDVVVLNSGTKTVSPMVTTSGTITFIFLKQTLDLKPGKYLLNTIRFKQGYNIVKISGNGTVFFEYTEGAL